MQLYLIRHGETDWNNGHRVMGKNPVPLNEKGGEAVRSLALVLEGEDIGVIYTSTVGRATETSRILAGIWGSKIIEEPRLDEAHYEKWVGKTFEELKTDGDFMLYMTAPTRSKFSAHEGMVDIQRRALEAVERIREEKTAPKVAAVSHSDVIKPLLAHYLDMDLDSMHKLSIANASVSLLHFVTSGSPKVRYINFAPWRWRAVLPNSG